MKVKKYVKKPIPVEAVLLTDDNFVEVWEWLESHNVDITFEGDYECIVIHTLEGEMRAYTNKDYIVKGTHGEFYPVKKKIFEKTYKEYKEVHNG